MSTSCLNLFQDRFVIDHGVDCDDRHKTANTPGERCFLKSAKVSSFVSVRAGHIARSAGFFLATGRVVSWHSNRREH